MSKRGYLPSDEKEFGKKSINILKRAAEDILYLVNRGYPIKNSSVFTGNHFMLSERQRTALVRAVSSDEAVRERKRKQLYDISGRTVNIDGFNIVITLETFLSEGTLIFCADGTVRDLAGLRGTYRLIDKTDEALRLIGKTLEAENIKKAVFFYDRPVSNSGRLKARTAEILENFGFETDINVINDVDRTLYGLENVITSDAVILDKCASWFNISEKIIDTQSAVNLI